MIRANIIRLVASSLMLLAAVQHFIHFLEATGGYCSWMSLIISLVYLITGILTLTGLKYMPFLGFIFSLTTLIGSLIKFGPDNKDLFVGFLIYINGLVVIFFIFLLLQKVKGH